MVWRHGALALCALQLLLLPPPGCAQLDASWTPAGDGPLPLSDNYRSKLRKLCRLLDKDQLPAKMESKRRSIADQCAQLREADAHAQRTLREMLQLFAHFCGIAAAPDGSGAINPSFREAEDPFQGYLHGVLDDYDAARKVPLVANAVVAKAAEGITYGDWASEVVRGQGEWGLMPYQAVMAAVYPATYCRGQRETMGLYPNEMNITRFSAWLGKNSSRGKVERELTAVGMGADCLPLVRRRMVDPLVANGKDGIPEVLAFMDSYNLTKEDREAIFDTLRLNKKEDLLKKVPTAVKSALTRALTKAGNVRDWEPPKPSKAKSKPKAKAKGKGKAKKK